MKTAKDILWEQIQAADPDHRFTEFDQVLIEDSFEGDFLRALIKGVETYGRQAFEAGNQYAWCKIPMTFDKWLKEGKEWERNHSETERKDL